MPNAAVGADVMVGFPGETDAEFEATRRMIEELPFTYLHVFTYSARPGTPAAEDPGQIAIVVARERNRELREIASQKKAAFMQMLLGTTVKAITLNSGGGDCTEALTDNYLKMRIAGEHQANRWMDVKVAGVRGEMLLGWLADEPDGGRPGANTKVHGTEQKTLTSNPLPAYDNKNQEVRE
jgi:threonylcarbamoyladenosine tRNA methylthiotransferase MtaB